MMSKRAGLTFRKEKGDQQIAEQALIICAVACILELELLYVFHFPKNGLTDIHALLGVAWILQFLVCLGGLVDTKWLSDFRVEKPKIYYYWGVLAPISTILFTVTFIGCTF